ncbi:hypothetical protein [Rhodococcus spongiicola]|uniref:hypothetical protein n=1 Tax=Rhodococcus spongiicola TaxID=2487352 RepID=UPI001F33A847|nr:hypothetical protein [Rhodococcus spongiicola]
MTVADVAPNPRPERSIDIFRRSAAWLDENLPPGWSMSSDRPRSPAAPNRLLITAPDGESVSYAIIARKGVLSGDVARIATELSDSDRGFVCAHYLSDPVRRQLDGHGISYADATGNVSLLATRPTIWVRNRGADADPWRGPGRPSGVLTGEPSERVVRALADYVGEMSVPELIRLSGTSTGAAYRVVEVLYERELLTRLPRGPITDVRWPHMLRAWAADRKPFPTRGFAAPGGLDELLARLEATGGDPGYAITGIGATDYAAPAVLELYADDVDAFASAMDLRPVDGGADVVVATPWSAVVFERMQYRNGLRCVAPAHAYADLAAGPFRHPDAAEYLLTTLTADEPAWRRPVRRAG